MPEFDLDRAFPKTPQAFSDQVRRTLQGLPRQPVQQLRRRRLIIATAALLALAGVVYASIQLGQLWFHQTEFEVYRKYYPEKYDAIRTQLQTDLRQETRGPAAALVDLKVQDGAWVSDLGFFSLSLLGTVKDADRAELYSLHEIDLDGALVGVIDPEDEDSRLEHYLKTPKGFGLPADVMKDPGKQLLLLDFGIDFFIGNSSLSLPGGSLFIFTTEQGPVMQVAEVNLKDLAPELRKAIRTHTDADGRLSLRVPFAVVPFADNAFGEEVPGELLFQIKVR